MASAKHDSTGYEMDMSVPFRPAPPSAAVGMFIHKIQIFQPFAWRIRSSSQKSSDKYVDQDNTNSTTYAMAGLVVPRNSVNIPTFL